MHPGPLEVTDVLDIVVEGMGVDVEGVGVDVEGVEGDGEGVDGQDQLKIWNSHSREQLT